MKQAANGLLAFVCEHIRRFSRRRQGLLLELSILTERRGGISGALRAYGAFGVCGCFLELDILLLRAQSHKNILGAFPLYCVDSRRVTDYVRIVDPHSSARFLLCC